MQSLPNASGTSRSANAASGFVDARRSPRRASYRPSGWAHFRKFGCIEATTPRSANRSSRSSSTSSACSTRWRDPAGSAHSS
jgi:hypothetical protein